MRALKLQNCILKHKIKWNKMEIIQKGIGGDEVITNREIYLEKKFYEELRRKLKNKLRSYPEGSICFRYQHGRHRPYLYNDGELKYIRTENGKLTLKLIDKKIIEKRVTYIEKNLSILSKLQSGYKGIEYIFGDGVVKELEEKIGNGFKVDDFLKVAKEEKNTNSTAEFLTDKKIHKTPGNVIVRSRAELVIATFLEMKGIDYVYEKPLKLFLRTVAPDFTIRRASDGKTIIWEHFGMMDDPGYYESRTDLLSDYHHAGWLPYENFIVTFGERDSPIDMTIIERICEIMLR